jgi:hypothetical protein
MVLALILFLCFPITGKIGALVPAAPPNLFYSPYDLPKDQSSDGSSAVVLDMEDGRTLQQQQQQALIAAPQTEYYQAREQAINEVEAVIRQLGQMFQQLSTMLAAQAELAERYFVFLHQSRLRRV